MDNITLNPKTANQQKLHAINDGIFWTPLNYSINANGLCFVLWKWSNAHCTHCRLSCLYCCFVRVICVFVFKALLFSKNFIVNGLVDQQHSWTRPANRLAWNADLNGLFGTLRHDCNFWHMENFQLIPQACVFVCLSVSYVRHYSICVRPQKVHQTILFVLFAPDIFGIYVFLCTLYSGKTVVSSSLIQILFFLIWVYVSLCVCANVCVNELFLYTFDLKTFNVSCHIVPWGLLLFATIVAVHFRNYTVSVKENKRQMTKKCNKYIKWRTKSSKKWERLRVKCFTGWEICEKKLSLLV